MKTKLFFLLTFLTANLGWGQVNITPTRTDVTGFSTWTDTNVVGTTFLQLLTAGANTVTLAPGVNCISSQWNVYQDVGGAPHDVVSGVTGIGVFRFIFSSATACVYTTIA